MKVIVAYVVLVLIPLVSAILTLALMPFTITLVRKLKQKFIISCISSIIETIITVFVLAKIFQWLDVSFGLVPKLILYFMFIQNGYVRLRTRGRTPLEYGYLVGDVVGITFGLFLFR